MNRPFAYIGFSCLVGLLVAFVLNNTAIITLIVILVLTLLVFIVKKMDLAPTKLSVFGFVLGLVLCLIGNLIYVTPYEDYVGQTAYIMGVVKELSNTEYDNYYYLVEVIEVSNEELQNTFNVELSSSSPLVFETYDYITCQVKFDTVLSSYKNSFLLLSAYSDNISLEASLCDYTEEIIANDSNSLEKSIYKLKSLLDEKIRTIFSGDNADIISAMLLGNKNDISDDIYENFRLSGVNHVLVVSGMHLAVVMGIIFYILTKVKIPRKAIFLIIIPIILVYIFLTGMSKSTLRSGIMMLILILSNLLGEDGDNLNSLGFAVMLICMLNAFSAADLGFLLSVSATAGIIICSDKIKNFICSEPKNKIIDFIVIAFSVSLSAFLFVMPILLYTYGTINVLSTISCTVLAFPTSVILVLSFICLLISCIPFVNILVIPLAKLVDIFVDFLLFSTEKIAIIGDKIPVLPDIRSVILFVGLILIIAVLFLHKPTFKLKILTLVTVLCMIISSYAVTIYQFENTARLMVLDTGEGIFTCIIKGDEAVVLIAEGYQDYSVSSILDDYGVKKLQILAGENEENSIIIALMEDYDITIFDDDYIFDEIELKLEMSNKLIELEYADKTIIINSIDFTSIDLECDIAINSSSTKIFADVVLKEIDNKYDYPNSATYINTQNSLFCITFNKNFDIRRVY